MHALQDAFDQVVRTKNEAAKHAAMTVEAQLARVAYFSALDDLVIAAQLVRESERKAGQS